MTGRYRRLKIYAVYLRHDDPKKNTLAKLARHGIVEIVQRMPANILVLDPFAVYPLSPLDKDVIASRGLGLVDCSWKKAWQVHVKLKVRVRRRLPILFAANPINYAKPYILSSAEAIAAALYITSFKEEAHRILSLFKWGHTFFELNSDLLEAYSTAKTTDDLTAIECEIMEKIVGRELECRVETLASTIRRMVHTTLAQEV